MGKEVIKDEEKLPFCSPAILMNARYFYEEGIYENWKNINYESTKKSFDRFHYCSCSVFFVEDNDGELFVQVCCWKRSKNMKNNMQDLYIVGKHKDRKKIAKEIKRCYDGLELYYPYKIIYKNKIIYK